jgi:hypothetical protein
MKNHVAHNSLLSPENPVLFKRATYPPAPFPGHSSLVGEEGSEVT